MSIFASMSLGPIWDMLNSLQIVMHIPLFKLKIPGNVATFIEIFNKLTSLQLFDVDYITDIWMYFPEMTPYSINF